MLRIQEKILIHRAQRGDQNAFARLYDEYVQHIQRFVFFKVSNQDKAEELVNIVFTKTFNYLSKGDEVENFRALLYHIARHAIIDFYRTKRIITSLEEVKEIYSLPDYQEAIDQKRQIEEIQKHLAFFEENVREIIILRFFEERSFKEIAKITGQREATIRMIAHRGVKELKRRLKEVKDNL